MAGFSLGRGSGSHQEDNLPSDNPVPPYSRGFELWQQHPHHHHHHLYPSSSQLLSFSNEHLFSIHGTGTGSGTRSSMRGGGSASGTSCQDCGNQAKKDCTHSRCRTCCKSRGFQCATHVKSTWVSAAKRRERQQQIVAAATLQQATRHHNLLGVAGSGGGEAPKRPRELILHTSGSRFTNALATSSGGGMEAAISFPSEVSSPAVFRCVRVSPIDDAEVEYAYQAAVSIGGHLFKGMLYDTGPEGSGGMTPSPRQHAESSSSAAATAITTSAAAVTTAAVVGSSGLLDPSALYPPPISAFMAGTQFFPHHPRP